MDGHVKYIYLSKTFDENGGGNPQLNQLRFNEQEMTAKGYGWLMTLRDNLKNYKND